MRFLSLDLLAFGHFHHQSLIFPPERDFCLIYGPNEAGKSTCLRALRSLLYGIEERTSDDFRHGARNLRIGATLAAADRQLAIVRRKGRKNTLLDPEENPLPETLLQTWLGGVGREVYTSLFGMTREELVEGGKALVNGKGSVGESLFAAGLAGTDLPGVLNRLEEEADALFRPAASNPLLNSLTRQYKELKKRSDDAALSFKDWERLATELAERSTAATALQAAIERGLQEKTRLERVLQALPLVAQLQQRRRERAALGLAHLLREDFSQEREAVQARLARAQADTEQARQRVAQLTARLAELTVPDELLAQEATLGELVKESGGVRKARQDLPRVQQQVNEARDAARELLAELRPDLDLEAVERLRLPLEQREQIRRLSEQYGPLLERERSALRREQDYTAKYAEAERELAALPPSRDVSGLQRLLTQLRKQGELEAACGAAETAAQTAQRQTEAALQRLPLAHGPLDRFVALATPSDETVNKFERDYDDHAHRLKEAERLLAEACSRVADLDGQLERLRLAGEVPLETDLAAARRTRERGWALVCQAWLTGVVDEAAVTAFDPRQPLDRAYEQSVQAADAVADRMRREAEAVARKAEYLVERQTQQQRVAEAGDRIERLQAERQALAAAWQGRWQAADIVPLSPREMRRWLISRHDLIRQADEAQALTARAQALRQTLSDSRDRLVQHLTALGEAPPVPDTPLATLLERAEALVATEAQLHTRHDQLTGQVRAASDELGRARRQRDQAQQELAAFRLAWAAAVRAVSPSLEVAAAPLFLEKVQDLFVKLKAAAKDQLRVEGMQRDSEVFEQKVWAFVGAFAPSLQSLPPEQAVDALKDLAARGRADAATRTGLGSQQEEWRNTLLRAQDDSRSAAARLAALFDEAGCGDLAALTELESRCAQARRLDADCQALSERITVSAGGQPLTEFMAAVAGEDVDQVTARLAGLERELADAQRDYGQVAEQIGALREQQRAMNGGADAAETAQQAQTVLADLRDGVERYLRLRLAARLLRAEIEQYRERHQGPLLRRAGELFATVTEGRFTALEASYENGDDPVLVGVRGDGGRVLVGGMSDGAQDQLYLALRLASLERYLEENARLPLVIDDALVNFDDDRASAALQVIGQLATRTQVLFFTHHRHLLELAKSVIDAGRLSVQSL